MTWMYVRVIVSLVLIGAVLTSGTWYCHGSGCLSSPLEVLVLIVTAAAGCALWPDHLRWAVPFWWGLMFFFIITAVGVAMWKLPFVGKSSVGMALTVVPAILFLLLTRLHSRKHS